MGLAICKSRCKNRQGLLDVILSRYYTLLWFTSRRGNNGIYPDQANASNQKRFIEKQNNKQVHAVRIQPQP